GGLYTWMMVAALVGLFQQRFSGASRWWKYLTESSYWCYLAGFPIQAAFQAWLAPRAMPILAEFFLVNVLTFAVLLVSYELCVRHTWIGLMLNGKRPVRNESPVTQTEPVVIATRLPVPEVPVCSRNEARSPASRKSQRRVLSGSRFNGG
ncbi:MAG: hypothetical protein L0241_25380, partial [Planctomycetia bacterium]|nr:hypothetical protein [Planctomycetia bacterium]